MRGGARRGAGGGPQEAGGRFESVHRLGDSRHNHDSGTETPETLGQSGRYPQISNGRVAGVAGRFPVHRGQVDTPTSFPSKIPADGWRDRVSGLGITHLGP